MWHVAVIGVPLPKLAPLRQMAPLLTQMALPGQSAFSTGKLGFVCALHCALTQTALRCSREDMWTIPPQNEEGYTTISWIRTKIDALGFYSEEISYENFNLISGTITELWHKIFFEVSIKFNTSCMNITWLKRGNIDMLCTVRATVVHSCRCLHLFFYLHGFSNLWSRDLLRYLVGTLEAALLTPCRLSAMYYLSTHTIPTTSLGF